MDHFYSILSYKGTILQRNYYMQKNVLCFFFFYSFVQFHSEIMLKPNKTMLYPYRCNKAMIYKRTAF